MPRFDGAAGSVSYREWLVPEPRAIAIFVHGVGEHSGLYDRFAAGLNQRSISLRALDQVGHGLTEGPRGVIESIDHLVFDAQRLTNIAAAADTGVPTVLIGHSLGGIVAALTAARRQDLYAGLVLSGTSLSAPDPGSGPDLAAADDGAFDLALADLSADPAYLGWLTDDPLVFTGGPEMTESLRRVLPPAWEELGSLLADLRLPVLMVRGEEDSVSPAGSATYWAARLARCRLVSFPGARHDVLNDTVHRAAVATIADFVLEVAARGGSS